MKIFCVFFIFLSFFQSPAGAEQASRIILNSEFLTILASQDLNESNLKLLSLSKDIENFLQTRLLDSLTTSAREQISSKRLVITLKENLDFSGFFVDPSEVKNPFEESLNELHIHLKFSDTLNVYNREHVLAHEFFHAVHYELHRDEPKWFREGMATLFEYLVLNSFSGMSALHSVRNPYTPLISDFKNEDELYSQYGHDFFYFFYLYQKCGGEELFWNLANGFNDQYGIETINESLHQLRVKNKEYCQDFNSSATSFEVARIHNRKTWSKEEDPDRYFLFPTTVKPPYFQNGDFEKALTFLRDLKPFFPVYLPSSFLDTYPEFLKREDLLIYWIDRRFPYSVTKTLQESNEFLDIIFLKNPNQ